LIIIVHLFLYKPTSPIHKITMIIISSSLFNTFCIKLWVASSCKIELFKIVTCQLQRFLVPCKCISQNPLANSIKWSENKFQSPKVSVLFLVLSLSHPVFSNGLKCLFTKMESETIIVTQSHEQWFDKVELFREQNFPHWQDKIIFRLTTSKIVNVLDLNLQSLPKLTLIDTNKVKEGKNKREIDTLLWSRLF